jgi:hypothetical protein
MTGCRPGYWLTETLQQRWPPYGNVISVSWQEVDTVTRYIVHFVLAFGPRVIWLTGIFCGSWVLGTDVRCELLIALLSEVRLHRVNGFADERP